uniref:Uncharacterized protein n=1 Tax=Avena sativa TaxID=4498 RepID=A0ACD5TAW4_AVESA
MQEVKFVSDEFTKLKNLGKDVKVISDELTAMKDALEGLANVDELDPQTKRWRDIAGEMSYDIEDIIDDFVHRIGGKQIKEIKNLLLETSALHQSYQLPIRRSSDVAIGPRVTTLYEKATNLVGMEGQKNKLVTLLADKEKQLKVVSIVGFAGLEKTTLANEVYRRLKSDFDCGAFVAVSQKLKKQHLSKLGNGLSVHGCDLNVLLHKVRECLQHKSLVLTKVVLNPSSSSNHLTVSRAPSNLNSEFLILLSNLGLSFPLLTTRIREFLVEMDNKGKKPTASKGRYNFLFCGQLNYRRKFKYVIIVMY